MIAAAGGIGLSRCDGGTTVIPDFSTLTAEQAAQFREHVVGREDARLADLARWVAATTGPLDALDGSIDSIEALWVWFLKFRASKFPGVPDGPRPSVLIEMSKAPPKLREYWRSQYVAETMQHYLFRVVRRVDPGARWAVQPDPASEEFQRTVIVTGGRSVDITSPIMTMAMIAHIGVVLVDEPTKLQENFLHYFGWSDDVPAVAPGPSVLAPYLEQPVVALDDPRRQPPVFEQVAGRAVEKRGEGGVPAPAKAEKVATTPDETAPLSDLILASQGSELENLESAKPISATSVATTMKKLGFVDAEGKRISAAKLRAPEGQFVLGNDLVLVETIAAGGRLRALMVQPINIKKDAWGEVFAAFVALAVKQRLRFASEDEF